MVHARAVVSWLSPRAVEYFVHETHADMLGRVAGQALYLVLHEGQQGRDDDCQATRDHGRQLVA